MAGAVPAPTEPLTFASAGGEIVADCYDDQAHVLSWAPTEGFKVKQVRPGPAPVASLELRNDNVRLVMTVTCPSGVPTVAIEA